MDIASNMVLTVKPEGYRKYRLIKGGKIYLAVVAGGIPKRTRLLRLRHRTATAAKNYGEVVATRWQKMFGSVATEIAVAENEKTG